MERRGRYLLLEWKGTSEAIGTGQEIMLKKLSLLPEFVIAVVRGNAKGHPETVQRVYCGGFMDEEPTDREDLQRRVDVWFKRVSGPGRERRKRVHVHAAR